MKASMLIFSSICLIAIIALLPGDTMAASYSLSGYSAIDSNFFLNDAAFKGQSNDPQFSWAAVPELTAASSNSNHTYKLTPFCRLDSIDDERTHFDLREAYWRYNDNSYSFLMGVSKVFWGVTESQHLVDIINQSDILEDINKEEKLGQPMIMLSGQRDLGEFQFYLMPYFRERAHPGESGRLRTQLQIDKKSRYESDAKENNLDSALRYSHYLGDWDFGAYYFFGTSREPKLSLSDQGDNLIATYDLIQQVGFDVQFTRDLWLWKLEWIIRKGHSDFFAATVGGFEYTMYQIFRSDADLGLLAEYNWDGRNENKSPSTTFNNDLFLGARLSLNDIQNTSALFGAIIDSYNGSKVISVEAERRICESYVIEATANLFLDIDEDDSLQSFQNDDFIKISLQYHF